MDLATLEITPDEARERLAEYEGLIKDERTVEDDAIRAGYRAAARGLPVIRLTQAISDGGWFDSGLPKIAVVRADATECFVRWHGDDLVFADHDSWSANRGALVGARSVRVTVADGPRYAARRAHAGSTIVPIVPPRHRPRMRRLRNCHVLWQVEEWKRIPPKDPALLRHIRGDLWSVLAVWDLTELERAVLSQRRA